MTLSQCLLQWTMTAQDLATQISKAWMEAVCRESCLSPTSCHTMLLQSELTYDDPLSFLRPPFLLPYAFHTIPQCFSNFCWLHCNKKYTVIRNITHANLGTCLRYVPIHRSEHKYVPSKQNFIDYILMSSVISQLSPWPTNLPDVAHHPPSSFFETVYFISITMCVWEGWVCAHEWVQVPRGSRSLELSYRCPWTPRCGCWEQKQEWLSSLWHQLLYPCLSQIIPWLAVSCLSFQKTPPKASCLTVWNKPVIFPLLLYLHAFYLLTYKPTA